MLQSDLVQEHQWRLGKKPLAFDLGAELTIYGDFA